MVNTLHHLPDVKVFLAEASRCLQPGGTISMIEPWNTPVVTVRVRQPAPRAVRPRRRLLGV